MPKELILLIEFVSLCILMFLICYFSMGTDLKNLNSFKSYPDSLQQKLKADDDYKEKIKKSNSVVTFFSNLIMFSIIIFVFSIASRTDDYLTNLIFTLILGEGINLFDILIMDLLWFKNSKRVRFSKYPDKELYQDSKNHMISFYKATIMFFIIALLDSGLLLLF